MSGYDLPVEDVGKIILDQRRNDSVEKRKKKRLESEEETVAEQITAWSMHAHSSLNLSFLASVGLPYFSVCVGKRVLFNLRHLCFFKNLIRVSVLLITFPFIASEIPMIGTFTEATALSKVRKNSCVTES